MALVYDEVHRMNYLVEQIIMLYPNAIAFIKAINFHLLIKSLIRTKLPDLSLINYLSASMC